MTLTKTDIVSRLETILGTIREKDKGYVYEFVVSPFDDVRTALETLRDDIRQEIHA